jgi:head-tail adaptor
MPAGKLRSRLEFQRREVSDDGYGNEITGDFATVFEDMAEINPRMGSEPVLAARLQGLQPVTIRVRSSAQTRTVDATWRARDKRTGAIYAIVSPSADIDQKNRMLDMLATVGGQTSQ